MLDIVINRLMKKYSWTIFLVFIIMVFVRVGDGTFTSWNPLFFIGEFCFGILFAYEYTNNKIQIFQTNLLLC
jgi:hypothetical protein